MIIYVGCHPLSFSHPRVGIGKDTVDSGMNICKSVYINCMQRSNLRTHYSLYDSIYSLLQLRVPEFA